MNRALSKWEPEAVTARTEPYGRNGVVLECQCSPESNGQHVRRVRLRGREPDWQDIVCSRCGEPFLPAS